MALHDLLAAVASLIIISWGGSFFARRFHAWYTRVKTRQAWDRLIADGRLINRV